LVSIWLRGWAAPARGHETFVGFQNAIRDRITSLPPGVFVAKGFASHKARFLGILHRLGFAVVAWDEEGLVHPPATIYYKRRISPQSLALLDGLFSWGPDYTQLIKEMPFYDETPLFETGNPRIDLLRKEVRGYFDDDVMELRRRFGRYILLNSNFGRVNSAVKRRRDLGVAGKPGNTALDKVWLDTIAYRKELYKHFRTMLASVAKAFPDHTILLRPHPSEKIESWQDIASAHPNINVLFEGNVVPWLMGAEILVHNGCTTAIESVLLDKPVIAFRPITSEEHDWHLPNVLSHSVGSIDELVAAIRNHLSGDEPLTVTDKQRRVLDDYVAFSDNRLASDIIVEAIEHHAGNWRKSMPKISWALGWIDAEARAIEKRFRTLNPGDIYSRWYQEKQFPSLRAPDVNQRIDRLAKATGRFSGIKAMEIYPNIFRLVGP
jgi:surface carbohydrate biosynthesis protein